MCMSHDLYCEVWYICACHMIYIVKYSISCACHMIYIVKYNISCACHMINIVTCNISCACHVFSFYRFVSVTDILKPTDNGLESRVCTCILMTYTCTHTYMYMQTHTYMYTQTHTYMYMYMYTHLQVHVYTYKHTLKIHTCTFLCVHNKCKLTPKYVTHTHSCIHYTYRYLYQVVMMPQLILKPPVKMW